MQLERREMVLQRACLRAAFGFVTNPLAIVAYSKLIPGSQVANRLQDLGYRVQAVNQLAQLPGLAAAEGVMLVLIDLDFAGQDVLAVIAKLRGDPTTQHLPVIAFYPEQSEADADAARKAGATLVASAAGIQSQLPQLLETVLRVE